AARREGGGGGGGRAPPPEQERVGVGSVRLTGAELDPASGLLSVREISVERPRARIERDAKGALRFAGLHTRPPPPEPASDEPVRPAKAPSRKPPAVSHVAVKRLVLSSGSCVWHDESLGANAVDL